MKTFICKNCGTAIESTEKPSPGTPVPSIVCWFVIVFCAPWGAPGIGMSVLTFLLWLAYISVHRRFAPFICSSCPACGSKDVIDIDSPIGRALTTELCELDVLK